MDIRNEIVDSVIKEIIGPSPNPNYLDPETGEEILLARVHGSPKSRYGAGMLYPQATPNIGEVDPGEKGEDQFVEPNPILDLESNAEIAEPIHLKTPHGDIDFEEPVGLANQYLPSAMGFTIRFKKNEKDDIISLNFSSAHYVKRKDKKAVKRVTAESKIEAITTKDGELLSDYWVRVPIKIDTLDLKINTLFESNKISFTKVLKKYSDDKDWLTLQVYNRSTKKDEKENYFTFTFVLINSIKASGTDDTVNSNYILYQNELKISTENFDLIVPYQERAVSTDTDEEKELNLLYRKKRVFAIGHGTAVNWETVDDKTLEKVKIIKTAVLPVYDIPQVAPTGDVELSMFTLSDKGNWAEAQKSLRNLTSEYSKWITEIEASALNSPDLANYREAAKSNVEKCKITLKRIQNGVDILCNAKEGSDVLKCFLWMNRAMLWQQQRSKVKLRKWKKTGIANNIQFNLDGINDSENTQFTSLEDFQNESRFNGRWRPFQLAFILMNIESIINSDSKEREIVDLIWFPTGGGKTEAYLGLTAFSIFYRRIKGKINYDWTLYGGTTVLMRYTLRLLTTQQYERASSLICACDLIRKESITDLGDESISIGLWVGGSSTPNDHKNAKAQFNQLIGRRDASYAPYNFIVMKCPCCGAQIGKLEEKSQTRDIKIKGLKKLDGTNGKIVFQCENTYCEYSSVPLPLNVVDDYIYENPPTLLLGTVDKFAMITWKPEAGHLFGFREKNGFWDRITPPELIIQDELHLIAGPLGTMVGLYETMVQTLCNNYNRTSPPFLTYEDNKFSPPKIIASSATISRAFEQVKSLYGIGEKNKLHIFPSQGLDFGNTWFSEEKSIKEKDEKGNVMYPGRKYVGILTSGYPSAQTAIVRTYSTVLQRVKELDKENGIDFYWTLLAYFNSIRELGGASSLVYGDVKERLSQIQNRELLNKADKRYINKMEELTSRITSGEIPEVLKKLEEEFRINSNRAIDICLATNMVATGVDISRLGLMFIHGQPKTTAEYIQASSRVGRKLPNGPGLIFTLYSPSKPRDKSQYEQFQGYHSRIYSNVEPTSVTPFSINAREKALHAILVGLVRQFSQGNLKTSPRIDTPEFDELIKIVKKLIIKRCEVVDNDEVKNTEALLEKRIKFWKKGFQSYGDAGNFNILQNEGFVPLLYSNSAEVREEIINENRSLATPTSMRGVDTESVINLYSNHETDGEE
jgi:hypothetical protein